MSTPQPLTARGAREAVAAAQGENPAHYQAWSAPAGSVHDGFWYVQETPPLEIMVDDSVWMVLPDGRVTRGIPVGNPLHEPTPLEWLLQEEEE